MEADSGTVGYLSPEAMQSWVDEDRKPAARKDFSCKESDVFAVGATLYQMISLAAYVSMRERRPKSINAETVLVDRLEYIDQCRSLEVRGGI